MSAAHDAAAMARHELPSLTALTAFEATLRHRSFTAAARELDRTQGAVSRQVALLESQLGRELFHREHPRLVPTRAAEAFGARLRKVLERLHAAVADAREESEAGGVLHLALLPAFGTTWLIPRLPGFLDANPEVSVELTTSLRRIDFEEGGVDAAIHYGQGTWPGARAELVMRETVVVVAAPERAAEAAGPADLVGAPLLQIVSRPWAWPEWLAAQGAEASLGARGPRFEHHMMAVEAACAGLGFALVPDFVARPRLASGDLVEPFDGARSRTGRGYWLVYPERSLELGGLLAFRRWLRDEARRDDPREAG
jgi:LysR family glycine cleavage system transcriptional activator